MANEPIENPVINSPFAEPQRHFKFADTGITNEIAPDRRKSVYFVPIPKPKQRSAQLDLKYEQQNEAKENRLINELRAKVAPWRRAHYPGVSHVTRRLLEYWQRPDRERKLFFCQIEALETIIYLSELSRNADLNYFDNQLREANHAATPEGHITLPRFAFKMATGSGKTVVMAMLIAWHTLNKLADRQARKFADAFLIVTPGITIKDRLRVLLPNDPDNYYQQLDLAPPSMFAELGKAKILITNYHAFLPREKHAAAKLTKDALLKTAFTETPGQMVARVCSALGSKKGIIVINDEAHHCYHPKPDAQTKKLEDEDIKEIQALQEEARVWINGLEAVQQKIGIRAVYDLSATPFFLRSSGYSEGMLFPWVVSDFSLTDAIESSIVKVPRVPVADNTAQAEDLMYRNLWKFIRKDIPKGTRRKNEAGSEPVLPKELQGALHSLYSNYEKAYDAWEQARQAGATDTPPPVFIIVCNNTHTSKMLFDYVAGYEKIEHDLPVIVPGSLKLFSNVEELGALPERRWSQRPNTLLIDSRQLESGEALSPDFKAVAQREIEEFQYELRARYPGRDVSAITDEELLREVMNTVGKPGKLGEHIKCVVSVSMLTEGWDANTVTHILGVRAFGTQLLCEQVVGRGLRRMSYEPETQTVDLDGQTFEFQAFPVEYAEVYGVPFEFIPAAGNAKPGKGVTPGIRVQSLAERKASRIIFPRVIGYRHEFTSERLTARFDESSQYVLTPQRLPTMVETAPIVGETSLHGLYDLEHRRLNEVAFFLAKRVLEKYFRSDDVQVAGHLGAVGDASVKPWLFPQLLAIVKTWLDTCLLCKDQTFPQMLLLSEFAHTAVDRIYHGIARAMSGESCLKPILHPLESVGSTDEVTFLTRKIVYVTESKCPLSHIVLDSGWERSVVQALEHLPQVRAYVKNAHLDFAILYTYEGEEHRYSPDFIAKVDDGHGADDLLNLVIEVSGEPRDDKAAKVSTIRNLWIPAVNNSRQFGRWAYLEIKDPYQAMSGLQEFLENYKDSA